MPGSEKLSETRLKKVSTKRRPVMMGKAHSPFWASHLQLRAVQDSALIWGGQKLLKTPSTFQNPQTLKFALNIHAIDRSLEAPPNVSHYSQPPAAPKCTKYSIHLCLCTFSSLCLDYLPSLTPLLNFPCIHTTTICFPFSKLKLKLHLISAIPP